MTPQGVSSALSPSREAHSKELGDNAELVIAPAFFVDMGWEYAKSSPSDNRINHFDYIVSRGSIERKIEVKAPKNCRNAKYAALCPILLEYTGIAGYPGWIRGQADVILQVITDDSLIAYHRIDALKAYKPPSEKVERYYSSNPPLQKWFGRQGLSKTGRPNQDIIRWEPYKAFVRDTNALVYRKINGRWQRPALN